eukprot:6688380-Pyramimonas_sp.AAC.1
MPLDIPLSIRLQHHRLRAPLALMVVGDVARGSVGASAHPPGPVTVNVHNQHLSKDNVAKIYEYRSATHPGHART